MSNVKQGGIKYHFWVFGITRLGVEPWSPGPLAKTGFLPSCSCVTTTIGIHLLHSTETHEEKAWWELHKNDPSCCEKIQDAAPHQTVLVWSLTFHLTNHPSKLNKIYWNKHEIITDVFLWIPTHGRTCDDPSDRNYLYHFCVDTGCCLENLPEAMLILIDGEKESQGTLCYQHDLIMIYIERKRQTLRVRNRDRQISSSCSCTRPLGHKNKYVFTNLTVRLKCDARSIFYAEFHRFWNQSRGVPYQG